MLVRSIALVVLSSGAEVGVREGLLRGHSGEFRPGVVVVTRFVGRDMC